MGGATSVMPVISRARSVSKRLIPLNGLITSIGRHVVIGRIMLYMHSTTLTRAARLVQVLQDLFQVLS